VREATHAQLKEGLIALHASVAVDPYGEIDDPGE
jgi:hypothetical protein